MVANLEQIEGRASMMYALDNGVPWHGEGTSVASAVTYEQALELAGMDWEVEQQKIRLVDGPQVQRYRATVRKTDRKVLGVTGLDYKLIQNRQAAEFLDSLYADGRLLFDTAGVIDNGTSVICWMLARLTEDMRVGDDHYGKFLLAAWAHDATRSLRLDVTNVRVVCENTLNIATGAKAAAIIRHTGDVGSKLEQARAVMTIADAKQRRMEEWLAQLNATPVDEAQVVAVQEGLFGKLDDATPTQRRNAIDAFWSVYNEEAERVGQTAYAIANAVTGFADHKTRITKNSTRMTSMLIGTAAATKQKGLVTLGRTIGQPMPV